LGIKDITVLVVFSILFFGCNENRNSISFRNPEEVKRLLQGNWYNYDKEWGLIFKNEKVYEYEDGIQFEGEYIIDVNSNPIRIIVLEDKKEVITFLTEFKNNHTLYIEESIDKETIFLTKVHNLPD
jgi:hypothetical protein